MLINIYVEAIKTFSRILWWIESLTEQHLFETKIFCNIINVFGIFNQINMSLSKSI